MNRRMRNTVAAFTTALLLGPLATPMLWATETANGKAVANGDTAALERSASIKPRPFKVPAALPDVAEMLSPSVVRIDGWLGARITANEKNRLLVVDTEPLLAGYRKRPGSHPWIGEHIGKWLHAATLAWAYTGDPALREKLDTQLQAELRNIGDDFQPRQYYLDKWGYTVAQHGSISYGPNAKMQTPRPSANKLPLK